MNSSINKYNKLLGALKREIEQMNNTKVKEILIDRYIKILCELATYEKNDYNYYRNKIEILNLPINKKIRALSLIKQQLVSKEIYIKEQDLHNKLIEDFKKPNNLLITVWIDNYISFINKYQKEVKDIYDFNTILDYISELDKENKYASFTKEYLNGKVAITNEELKIKTLKRGKKSNTDILKAISNEEKIPTTLLSKITTYFKRESIAKEDLEKAKSEYLKGLLIKKSNQGEIPENYKKHRIKLMLLNMDLLKTSKIPHQKFIINNEKNQNVDIYKGLGKC